MGVESEGKGNEEVVGIPESFERLVPDLVVGSGVDEQHAQNHGVASDTVGFSVMNLKRLDGPQLADLDVDEVDVVTAYVHSSPPYHLIRDHSVKPLRLIEWKPPNLWSNDSKDGSAHGQENEEHIER